MKRKAIVLDTTNQIVKARKKKKTMKISKQVKSILDSIEVKYFDTTLNTTAITTAGIIVNASLNNIVLGDDNNNRTGRKVQLKSVHLRGAILEEAQTVLANMSNFYRFIVYLDKQCNAATAAVTDVLSSADEKSFNNLNNSKRFQILYDDYFELRHEAQSVLTGPVYSTHRVQHKIEFHKKLNIPIHYNATNGGTVADVTSNNIGVLAIAQSANGGSCDMIARVRFSDLS